MRKRLLGTSLAVTSMVVVSFLIPLGLLVGNLAHDRALAAAEREAESIARFLAVVGPTRGFDDAVGALGDLTEGEFGVSLILADGTVIGDPLSSGEDVTSAAAGNTSHVEVEGGDSVHVPILQSDGSVVVVRVFAPDALLNRGVLASWVTLAVLGVVLIAIAVFVFDRLARSIVGPVEELSRTAAALGDGDLDTRVEPAGPKEVRSVGTELNRLAGRVEQLLQQERETAADLSHQLRTPLTALRLEAEALPEGPERTRILEGVDELARHVDYVIRGARREVARQPGLRTDFAALLRSRLEFWTPLAEEQGREVSVSIPVRTADVLAAADDLETMIDALVGNVFGHTDEGTPFDVTLVIDTDGVIMLLDDAGPGFPDASVLQRGASGGSGTGLGLDIARRVAESAGGSMTIGASQRLGGALVTVAMPTAS